MIITCVQSSSVGAQFVVALLTVTCSVICMCFMMHGYMFMILECWCTVCSCVTYRDMSFRHLYAPYNGYMCTIIERWCTVCSCVTYRDMSFCHLYAPY